MKSDFLFLNNKSKGEILLSGVIDEENIKDYISQLYSLVSDPEIKYIIIKINSTGGDVFSSLAFINSIRAARTIKPIIGINMGICMSAAFWIFCNCTKRISFDTSIFMFHGQQIYINNFNSIQERNNRLINLDKPIESLIETLIIKECPRFKIVIDEYKKTNLDIYFSAQRLKELEVVTDIITVLHNDEYIEENLGGKLND